MEVHPNLLLGNRFDAKNETLFVQYKIEHVLNVTDNLPCTFEKRIILPSFPTLEEVAICTNTCDIKQTTENMMECVQCKNNYHPECVDSKDIIYHTKYVCKECVEYGLRHKVAYHRISVVDSAEVNISLYFDEGTKFLEGALKQNKTCLVHCREGRSRSCTLIIAYLMKIEGWSLLKAYKHMEAIHPKLNINNGFKLQLMTYETDIQKEQNKLEECTLNFFQTRTRTPSRISVESSANKKTRIRTPKAEGKENVGGSLTPVSVKRKLQLGEGGPQPKSKRVVLGEIKNFM
ncbi:dual specificity protein phosphatase [Acrasis kona]|uniref:protein-tyrosine-phosphatase n=1 Tax=Acrasis kona TaxID=1008807 RepID=A0AAW2ZC96_9EUKA